MTINSRSAKLSSPNVKVQDVPNVPTIGAVAQDSILDAVNVSFTPAATGGRAAIYRAVSNPGNIEAISYGSSPVQVSGLTDGTEYTFAVRGETATGATTGYTSESSPITPDFGSYDLISSQILSSAVTSINFTSIPTNYKHLQIRIVSNVQNDVNLRFNSDSGSNYSYHYMYANLSSSNVWYGSSSSTNRVYLGYVNSSSSTVQGLFIADILDAFSTSKFKTTRTLSGTFPDTATQRFLMLNSSSWRSTAAVNSIGIFTTPDSQFGTGSRISLYGIKG